MFFSGAPISFELSSSYTVYPPRAYYSFRPGVERSVDRGDHIRAEEGGAGSGGKADSEHVPPSRCVDAYLGTSAYLSSQRRSE